MIAQSVALLTFSIERFTWGRWGVVKFHAAIVILIAIVASIIESPTEILKFGGITIAITYPILAFLEAKKAPLWFSPLSFYFAWYSIGLGISAAYFGFNLTNNSYIPFSVALVSIQDLVPPMYSTSLAP